MKKVIKSKVILSILSLVLIVAMALTFSACGNDEATNGDVKTEKTFVFKVIELDESESSFTITTTASTVGEALTDEGLISGTMGDYGLMVDTVNGQKYDYNADGAYWAFYVDGAYATSGVDTTEIDESRVYSFVATKA